jgi:hypothetical protein
MIADAFFRGREGGEHLKPADQFRAAYRSYAKEMSRLSSEEQRVILIMAEKEIESKGVDMLSGYSPEQWIEDEEEQKANALEVVSIFKDLVKGKKNNVRRQFDLAVAYFLGLTDDMDKNSQEFKRILYLLAHDEDVRELIATARPYLLIEGYKVDDF